MSSKRWAQIGLVSFAGVFACSLAVLLAGYVSPTIAEPLMVGQRVGDFALYDTQGAIQQVQPVRRHVLMLVYAPAVGLSKQQAERIADLRRELELTTPVDAVAILASSSDNDSCTLASEVCDQVLCDPQRMLWPIQSMEKANASVCLVDDYGYLRFRAELQPEEALASAPRDRPLLRKALTSVSLSQATRVFGR